MNEHFGALLSREERLRGLEKGLYRPGPGLSGEKLHSYLLLSLSATTAEMRLQVVIHAS